MNVKELIISVGISPLTEESWRRYRENGTAEITPDFRKGIVRLLSEIRDIEPIKTGWTIAARTYEPDGLDVFVLDSEGQDYSLLFVKLAEVLGYEVPEELAENIGQARLAAAILYGMTWFAASSEENDKAAEQFAEDCKDVDERTYSSFSEIPKNLLIIY